MSTRSTPGRANALTRRASSRRSSRASSACPSVRARHATSATGGAGSPCTAAPTRAPSGTKTAELELRVLTFPARGFTQRRLGSAPREEQYGHPSAVMDLGEAVQTAVDAGLPLLLSTEAAGELKDTRARRADEGPARDAHDHYLRRRVGDHAPGGRRAGDRRAARAQARASEGDALGRGAAGGADDARATVGRRPGAARPPARDGRAEGRRLRRRRICGRHREDDLLRPGARAPRLARSRGSAGSSSRRAGCSASGARSSRAARRAAGCRRWRRTSSCSSSPTIGRSPGRSGASTASSATGPGVVLAAEQRP